MAFYLVLSLAATAGLFFLAGADFVGAMQLLIYVGGTLVLLVFGVMLTSQDRFISMKTSREELWIAALVGACLLVVLVWAAVSVPDWNGLDRPTAEAIPLAADGRADRHGLVRRAGRLRRIARATCWSSKSFRSICWWCCSAPPTWPGPNAKRTSRSVG